MAIEDNYLPYLWTSMTEEEKLQYYEDLGNSCQEHRYRYYDLDDCVISDFEYDYIEKMYKEVSRTLNKEPIAVDMVDWDETKPGALQSKNKVLAGEDHYSVHQKRMLDIWEKIGKPRYVRKGEAK